MPNTFKTQVCLNTLQIPFCLWCFLSLSGWLTHPASPSFISSSSTNPSPWLLLVLCEHPSLEPGWGCRCPGRALLCPELLLHSAPTSPDPWPDTASMSRTDQGHRNCPVALRQLSLWPSPSGCVPLAIFSQAPLAKAAQGQLWWGSTPRPATRMFQTLPSSCPTPLDRMSPVS